MNNNIKKYWAEIYVQPNGTIKIAKADKLVQLNQYKTKWKATDARNLARLINNSDLVIK